MFLREKYGGDCCNFLQNAIFYFIEIINGRLLFASDSSVAGADRLAGGRQAAPFDML